MEDAITALALYGPSTSTTLTRAKSHEFWLGEGSGMCVLGQGMLGVMGN